MPGLRLSARGRLLRAAVLVALGASLLGAGLGVLWERLAPEVIGTVFRGRVVLLGEPATQSFDAVGIFVLLSAGAGLVFGTLVSWLGRRTPVLALGALVGGSVLATTIMYSVGRALGPTTPPTAGLEDGALVPVQLGLTGIGGPVTVFPIPDSPLVVFTFAAVLGAIVLHLTASLQFQSAHPAPPEGAAGVEGPAEVGAIGRQDGRGSRDMP